MANLRERIEATKILIATQNDYGVMLALENLFQNQIAIMEALEKLLLFSSKTNPYCGSSSPKITYPDGQLL